MTESLNAYRRALMGAARNYARQAQDPDGPGLIRGDLIKVPYDVLLDTCIELLHVCPIELIEVAPAVDVIPCQGCEKNVPVTANGRLYCSEACRKHVKGQRLMDRRAAA